MPKLDLDLKAVSAKIGRSTWTTRYYVRTGRIPFYRPGGADRGKLAFDSDEINRWLIEQRNPATPDTPDRGAGGRFRPAQVSP